MAINYPLSLPASNQQVSITLKKRSVVAVTESPFTLEQQTQVHQGQAWMGSMILPKMNHADVEMWNAFFFKLNGREGTFLLGDPKLATPRGAAKNTPSDTLLVNGASQTGNSIDIDGATINVTDYFLEGDYFQLGTGATSRLHKILNDVSSNGSGELTLDIWPKLRSSPANNAAVTFINTVGRFRLAVNDYEWRADRGTVWGFKFPDFVEAL